MIWVTVLVAVLLIMGSLVIWGLLRGKRLRRFTQYATTPVPNFRGDVDLLEFADDQVSPGKSKVNVLGDGSPAAFAAVAIGVAIPAQALFYLSQVDPTVIEGVAASGSAMVSSGQDYFGFLQYVAENATKLDSVGFTSRLQGYVGEIQAQDILSEQGFTAVLASTSNNPGYDLSVDGLFNGYEFIDVKVAGDMAMVERSALERPDIAHFVNGDVAGKSDLPNVFVNQDLSREDIQETLQTSLGAAESLTSGDLTGSLGDPVALAVMMGLVVLNQVRAVRNGEKSAEAAVVDGTWIIAGRAPGLLIGMGFGASAGAKAGSLVDFGSIGASAGAGALAGGVIGGLVGGIAGTELGDRTAKRIRNRPILHNGRRLDEALQRYGNVCRESGGMVELDTLIRRPLDRATQISDSLTEKGNKIRRTWRWWLWPDADQVLIVESARVSVIETGKCREIYESVRTDLDRIGIASDSDTAIGLLMANNPVLRVLTKCDLPELQDVRLFYVRQLRLLKQRKQPISSSRLVRKARGQITDK